LASTCDASYVIVDAADPWPDRGRSGQTESGDRRIEARDGGTRQDLRSPEKERDPAPIELICLIGGRLFAFEHTGIEPFEGQIDIEAKRHFRPLRDVFSGQVPPDEQYELRIPVGATRSLAKERIRNIISALGDWIRAEVAGFQLASVGRYGIPAMRPPDDLIPFEIALYRNSLPGIGHLSIVHVVDNLDGSRAARIERACKSKFPKLALWRARGARTVLILEGVDDQLTDPEGVAPIHLRE
jgi:hypothetical protein